MAVGIGELAQRELLEEQESALAAEHEGEPWRNSVDLGTLAHRASHPACASAGATLLEHASASFGSGAPMSSGGRGVGRGVHRRVGSNPPYGDGTPTIPDLLPLLASSSGGGAARAAGSSTLQSPLQVECSSRSRGGGGAGTGTSRSGGGAQLASNALSSPLLLRSAGGSARSGRSGCAPGGDDDEESQQSSPGLAPPFVTPQRSMPLLGSGSHVASQSIGTSSAIGNGLPPIMRSRSETHLAAARSAALDAAGAPRSQAQHYEVERFRRLRAYFGISAATFAHSFPDDVSKFDHKWAARLKESLSEGKSGSFFYRVVHPSRGGGADGRAVGITSRFIVKQISRKEKNALMSMLPAYEAHVARHKGRCFIQYLSCHSMTLRWALAGKVYFVVMTNLMPVPPWLLFDLKGATANRRGLAARYLHQEGRADDNPRAAGPPAGSSSGRGGGGGADVALGSSRAQSPPPRAANVTVVHSSGRDAIATPSSSSGESLPPARSPYPTLRDWEWMDIAMAVDVSPDDQRLIAETIASDAAFLGTFGMLDYSLLVGIHRLPPNTTPQARDAMMRPL